MKFSLPIILIALHIPAFVLAEEPAPETLTPEKIAAIQELMEATGTGPFGSNIADTYSAQMISSLKSKYPDATEQSFDIVRKEIEAVVTEELDKGSFQDLIYPIYAKYFTEEDIRGLIEFNKSDLGRKSNEVMPRLLQESMQAGQIWSLKLRTTLVERVTEKLKQEGIELNNPQ